MKSFPRWFPQVISMEMKKRLQYRFDFWGKLLLTLFAQMTVAYSIWSAIYAAEGEKALGGFTFHSMMFYYIIANLLMEMACPPFSAIANDIYDGALTRYLLYPLSFFHYKYAAHVAQILFGVIQLFLGLTVFFLLYGIPESVHPSQLCLGLVTAFIGSSLYFLMIFNLEAVAFWTDNVWSLSVLLQFVTGILGGRLLPLTTFPLWAQDVLDWLPFSKLLWFPAQVMMGSVSFEAWIQGIGISLFWCLFFWLTLRVIWRRGSLRYTGVGI